jgi:hypothetical protein
MVHALAIAERRAHEWGGDVVSIMESPHLPMYDRAFGSDRAKWRAASPYHVVTKRTAPMLVVCSSRRAVSCSRAHACSKRTSSRDQRRARETVGVHERGRCVSRNGQSRGFAIFISA